jgi:hypothetical protein
MHLVNTADHQLEQRVIKPFSRQELAVLVAALLLEKRLFQLGVYLIAYRFCHPERSEKESKDLRTDLTAKGIQLRRFLDFVLRTSLGMTYLLVRYNCPINRNL